MLWFQFTVTRVEDDSVSLGNSSGGVSTDRVLLDGYGDHPATRTPGRPDSLGVPEGAAGGGGASSDNESSYGDTLTQTSITKLLSNKFKVSGKACVLLKRRSKCV